MTGRRRTRAIPTNAARIAVAGAAIGLSGLVLAGPAGADPDVPPPDPGQPVVVAQGADPAAPPAPPPVGPPVVPEIQNPQYGQGTSPGPLSFLRDAWHQAQDPYGFNQTPQGEMPQEGAPPPGAGPAPQLPPGYTSLNAPESSGPPPSQSYAGGPALPPGYFPLTGPPPPGYFDGPPPPAAPPPPAPGAYVPVHSPPPPPLLPPDPPPPPL
jgi:hypothetical protein